ncbi:MAG: TonB-dependent receptor plug domain-containing protein, partial [Phycisphaerales bacterium]|nr:TonB-dependent receptor plug domain-containing protein [Phycisphaerales bacterium]
MNKPLLSAASAAARYGLVAVLGAGFSVAQAAQPTPANPTTGPVVKEEPAKLEKFEVTGSRIKRLDLETPAPVQTFTVENIEAKGYTNIGDFIQALPFNSGGANSIYQTASFTRGAATANPRGLGSNRFLVLINGRRAITYGLTNSNNNSVFDFNSIPPSAIESIEYLKDGASAIYGSDAVTGVLNIKLKRNFSGLTVSSLYGNTLDHDSGFVHVNALIGTGTGKTKAMVALDYKTQNSNFLRDYGRTTTDYSDLGTNKGANLNSSLNWPANLSLTAAQATPLGLTAGTYVIRGGTPTPNPTLASFQQVAVLPNENRYNFAQTYQRYPAYDYASAYTSFEHEFTDSLTAFAEIMYSNNRTYYAFTPGVIQFGPEGLTLPANSPYNPFRIPLTSLLGRTNFGPVRKFDTDSNSSSFLGGVRGTVLNRWNWEVAAAYGQNQVASVARNAIRATTYQAALNGTLSGFTNSFFNPFGPSANPELEKALFTSSSSMN